MNICTKYGFDILIISGSYGGTDDTRRTTDDERRTTDAGVWHKLPTGELKNYKVSLAFIKALSVAYCFSLIIKVFQIQIHILYSELSYHVLELETLVTFT